MGGLLTFFLFVFAILFQWSKQVKATCSLLPKPIISVKFCCMANNWELNYIWQWAFISHTLEDYLGATFHIGFRWGTLAGASLFCMSLTFWQASLHMLSWQWQRSKNESKPNLISTFQVSLYITFVESHWPKQVAWQTLKPSRRVPWNYKAKSLDTETDKGTGVHLPIEIRRHSSTSLGKY